MNTDAEEGLRAAAIEDDGSCDVDALLAAIAMQQRRRGRRVRGLVMTHPPLPRAAGAAPKRAMVLVDLHTRQRYPVSQDLGPHSQACCADPQGFARASAVLRRACEEAPDLVICNRFGRLEAEGAGFRAELLAIMSLELPLLTVVASAQLEAWAEFTGGTDVLVPRAEVVTRWLESLLAPAPVCDRQVPIGA